MITLPTGTKIWIIAGITDMRCGFNGLASKVQNTLKDDPFSGHIFVFRDRSGKMVENTCGPIVTGYACSPNAWNGAASSGR
ncbi:putative transposase [Shigella boydii 5216-82]|nr:putative transposase [Shigella boydii 5216-82]